MNGYPIEYYRTDIFYSSTFFPVQTVELIRYDISHILSTLITFNRRIRRWKSESPAN